MSNMCNMYGWPASSSTPAASSGWTSAGTSSGTERRTWCGRGGGRIGQASCCFGDRMGDVYDRVVLSEREGDFYNSDISVLQNIEIFSGQQNLITMSRMYNIEFMCEYQLHMYPYDTQTCYITMIMDIRIQRFVEIKNGNFSYIGPIDLQKYFVKATTMEIVGNSLQMKVVLGRKLMNEILTTFLPTGHFYRYHSFYELL